MQAKFKIGDKIQLISKRILIKNGYSAEELDDLEEYNDYHWDTVFTIDSIEWEDADNSWFVNFGITIPDSTGYFAIVVHDNEMESYEYDDVHMFELVKTVGFVID